MENFDAPWEEDELDPEVWFQALLAMTNDKAYKEKVVAEIEKKTGLSPQKVEFIIAYTLEFMANRARSN